jgi:hypothetical protein
VFYKSLNYNGYFYFVQDEIEAAPKIKVVILSVSEESYFFLFKSENQKRDPSRPSALG